jgi:hypothetical protein
MLCLYQAAKRVNIEVNKCLKALTRILGEEREVQQEIEKQTVHKAYIRASISLWLCWALAAFSVSLSTYITQPVGLLGRGISPSCTQDSANTEQTHTNIHASSGIRIRDPSV